MIALYCGCAAAPLDIVGEELATRDAERANALLDAHGNDSFRLYTDGSSFAILIAHGARAPDSEPASAWVSECLKEAGIDASSRNWPRPSWIERRRDNNEAQATAFWAQDQGWNNEGISDTVQRVGCAGRVCMTQSPDSPKAMEAPAWGLESFERDKTRWGLRCRRGGMQPSPRGGQCPASRQPAGNRARGKRPASPDRSREQGDERLRQRAEFRPGTTVLRASGRTVAFPGRLEWRSGRPRPIP